MSNKHIQASEHHVGGTIAAELGSNEMKGYTEHDRRDMWRMGKKQELRQGYTIVCYCVVTDGKLLGATSDSFPPSDMPLACECGPQASSSSSG